MDDVVNGGTRRIASDELLRLGAQVRVHADMLDEESLSTPHIDYELARSVASVLCSLIEYADAMDSDQRARVADAARYFVLTDDDASDLDVSGLLDDAAAIRAVCEQVGLPELARPLEE